MLPSAPYISQFVRGYFFLHFIQYSYVSPFCSKPIASCAKIYCYGENILDKCSLGCLWNCSRLAARPLTTRRIYRKRWYLANVKLDMFISILYVNIANLKSVPIEIFAEILNVFMIVRNIRQNSDVFYIETHIAANSPLLWSVYLLIITAGISFLILLNFLCDFCCCFNYRTKTNLFPGLVFLFWNRLSEPVLFLSKRCAAVIFQYFDRYNTGSL